jgi:hypothetical protein
VDLPTSVVTSRLSPGGGGNASTSTTSRSVSNVVGVTERDTSYFEINGDSGELRLRMSDEDGIQFMKDKKRVDFQFWAGATDEGGLHSYIPVTVVLLPEGIPSPEMMMSLFFSLSVFSNSIKKFRKQHENTLLLSFVIGTLDWELEL